MTFDPHQTLLLWDPDDPKKFGLDPRDFESRGIRTLETRYERIGRDPQLVQEVRDQGVQALIFTRNDDMPPTPLIAKLLADAGMGYTTISAIDRDEQESQTKACLKDLLAGHGTVELPSPVRPERLVTASQGTFSLIFDLEQFGGARFGMPRLLPLLESRGVHATFFVTGFISEFYPDLIRGIVERGHEIAIHGSLHEFLKGRPGAEQIERVRGQVRDLESFGPVCGANFIFRMDRFTPEAFVRSGLQYFVLFRKHLFYRTRFIDASTLPRVFRTPAGDLTMLPVSAETYGLPRAEVKGMLDSAVRRARKDGGRHINVLLHPFKDGVRERIPATQWLLDYLVRDLRLDSRLLRDVPVPLSPPDTAGICAYRWDGDQPSADAGDPFGRRTLSWWVPQVYHSRRVEALADALMERGSPAVLGSDMGEGPKLVAVYPDGPVDKHDTVAIDPMIRSADTATAIASAWKSTRCVIVAPPSRPADCLSFVRFHVPRTFNDLRVFVPRAAAKLLKLIRRAVRQTP